MDDDEQRDPGGDNDRVVEEFRAKGARSMSGYNDRVVEEFRANGGTVKGFGDSLVLIHSLGTKSGEPRITPTMALRDGDGWLVIASAAGAPKHPAWYHNLVAHPQITIETPTETVAVRAVELQGNARFAAFERFVEVSKTFAEYQERAGERVMPIFRLEPGGAVPVE